jgi:hypothetical protein
MDLVPSEQEASSKELDFLSKYLLECKLIMYLGWITFAMITPAIDNMFVDLILGNF